MKRRRRNALFSFHPGFLRGHQQRRPEKSRPATRRPAAKRTSPVSADTQDLLSALRNLGYRRDVAASAVKAARGSDFDSRLRHAMNLASGRRFNNPMKKKRSRKKNSRPRLRRARRVSRPRRRVRRSVRKLVHRPAGLRLTRLAKVKKNPHHAPKHAVVKGRNPISLQSTRAGANKLARWLRNNFPGSKIKVVRAERFLKK